jgi:hypothetical protein
MDSACSDTIAKSTEGIALTDSSAKLTFTFADKSFVVSQGTGVICPNEKNLKMHVVESFGENLLSIPQLYDRNIHCSYDVSSNTKLSKESAYLITIFDFPTHEVKTPFLTRLKAQPHRNLLMQKLSKKPYEMLHIDFKYIGVRSREEVIGESTIVDDFSRNIHIIPLHSKRHFLAKFQTGMVQHVTSRRYKTSVIRCTEMKNYKFIDLITFMNAIRIRADFTSSNSPDSEGVV